MPEQQNEFVKRFESIVGDLQQKLEAYKEACANAVDPLLKSVFKAHGHVLPVMVVRGYTPGFNDGDPCAHGQYFLCPFQEFDYYDQLTPEDWYMSEDFREHEQIVTDYVRVSDSLEDAFADKYGTNFELVITWDSETESYSIKRYRYHSPF